MSTSTVSRPTPASDRPVAGDQAAVQSEDVINSANSGFLVMRTGQMRAEFYAEGVEFAMDLVEHINAAMRGHVTVLLFEEMFGSLNRLHWLIHLKQPNDYHHLLEMVDHSDKWREISERQRLTEKGGGGWDRMFVEGALTESVFCPQHGIADDHDEDHTTFQPSARHQTALPDSKILHSANSPFVVHRAGQARYAYRDEARVFTHEWASYVNDHFDGEVTAFLYEEMWGRQDRLHVLIHLRSIEAYDRLIRLPETDAGLQTLLAGQKVYAGAPTAGWHTLFVDGSLDDALLVPRYRSS